MQTKRTIPLVALALFTASILLFSDNIESAYAITISDVALPITPDVFVYAEGVDRYLAFNSGSDVQVIHPETKAIVASYSLSGIDDITCSGSVCYTAQTGGTDNDQFVIGFNPLTGAIVSNATFNLLTGAYGGLDDLVSGSNKMIAHNGRVYNLAFCDNGNYVMVITEGSNPAGQIGDCSGTHIGSSLTTLGMVGFENKIAITTDSASTNAFQIWFTSGNNVCKGPNLTLGTAGHLAYSAQNDVIYMTTASSQRVDIMNVDDCTDDGDITSAQHGLTTVLRGIQVSDDRDEIFIQSTTDVAVMNLTATASKLYTFSVGDTSTARDKTTIAEEFDQYATAYSTTARIVDLDAIAGSVGSTVCIQLLDTGQMVCYDDTNGDGLADAGGALEIVSNQNPPATAIGKLFCQIGFVTDCTNGTPSNGDVKSNGIGLILFFITLAVMLAIVGSALYGKIKVEYNLMMQIPVILIAVGIAVAFEWLDTLWFYLMVFVIIGFASMASATFLLSKVRGGGGSA